MTERLERAVEAMKRMSVEEIDREHLPFVLEGLAQVERGEFASDEDVEKAFRSFDR